MELSWEGPGKYTGARLGWTLDFQAGESGFHFSAASPPWKNQTTAQGGYGCPSGTGPHRPKVRSAQRSLGDGPRQRLLCHSLSPMSSPGCHVPGKGGGWQREGRRTSAFFLSYDQLLGTWPGAWNETRKPLIYIIC